MNYANRSGRLEAALIRLVAEVRRAEALDDADARAYILDLAVRTAEAALVRADAEDERSAP